MQYPTDGPLLKALTENGFESLTHLSNESHIKHEVLSHINNNYRNMRTVYGAGGRLNKTARIISELLGCNPEDAYHPEAHFDPKNPQPDTMKPSDPSPKQPVYQYDHHNENECATRINQWMTFLFNPIKKYTKKEKERDACFDVSVCFIRSKLESTSFKALAEEFGYTSGQAKGHLENIRLMCARYYAYERGDISDEVDLFDWLY